VTVGAAVDGVALQLRGIIKRFGAVTALDRAHLTVRGGTVHALVGENGAGKSTLMRIAAGLETVDAGSVELFGRRARGGSVAESAASGLGMVHQHLSLVPALTTTENFALGRHGLYRGDAVGALLARTSADAGLSITPDVPVSELSIVEQQRLEIVKALARGARILVLDEPTAVLAPQEVQDLLSWIRRFAARGGTIVLVTHKLREVIAVADDVTVLRRGAVVLTRAVAGASEEALADAIFGQGAVGPNGTQPSSAAPNGDVVVHVDAMDVSDLRGVTRIRAATLDIRRGEIVGVAAVEGSGHRELMLAVAGLRAPDSGRLVLPRGIAFVPADRARDAMIPEFSLTENFALRGAGSRRGVISWPDMTQRTRAGIARFEVVASSPAAPARSLSGGNQQRLILARELEGDVDLVVADNPTRGLDARGTRFVHEQLRAAAARGAAVVMHSSDLDEVLGLASRVLVVHHGTVREQPVDRDVVGRAMLGVE